MIVIYKIQMVLHCNIICISLKDLHLYFIGINLPFCTHIWSFKWDFHSHVHAQYKTLHCVHAFPFVDILLTPLYQKYTHRLSQTINQIIMDSFHIHLVLLSIPNLVPYQDYSNSSSDIEPEEESSSPCARRSDFSKLCNWRFDSTPSVISIFERWLWKVDES